MRNRSVRTPSPNVGGRRSYVLSVCEHFFEWRSFKIRQIWLFGERGE